MPRSITPKRYPALPLLRRLSGLCGLQVAQFAAASDLPASVLRAPYASLSAAQVGQAWRTAAHLTGGQVDEDLLRQDLRSHFSAVTLAFMASATVAEGLNRAARLFPLSRPYALQVSEDDALHITIVGEECPPLAAEVELAQLLELASIGAGRRLEEVTIEAQSVRLTSEDAHRQLVTPFQEHWAGFDQLGPAATDLTSVSAEAEMALMALLPAGRVTAEAVSAKIATSKRSLQRRLGEEGTSFQMLLATTRKRLALHYLQKSDLRIEEIAEVLSFRDTNSFYRAFQSWTGQTPRAIRSRI
ncbi:MAG: helix-turn-helix domain-containing protein [Pseudomonadota bacterium]